MGTPRRMNYKLKVLSHKIICQFRANVNIHFVLKQQANFDRIIMNFVTFRYVDRFSSDLFTVSIKTEICQCGHPRHNYEM